MFDEKSRYKGLPELSYTTSDGTGIVYKARRLVPKATAGGTTTLGQSERLDLVAFRVLGDPLAFWRLCDCNEELSPFELEAVSGRALKTPSTD